MSNNMCFRDIAYNVWGCVPIDRNWAINTLVFKSYLELNNIKSFKSFK